MQKSRLAAFLTERWSREVDAARNDREAEGEGRAHWDKLRRDSSGFSARLEREPGRNGSRDYGLE